MQFFSRRRGTSTADELPASSGCRQSGGRPLNLKLSTRSAQFYKFRSRIQRRHPLLIVVSARASMRGCKFSQLSFLLCVSFSPSFPVFSPFPGVPGRHPAIKQFVAQFELKTAILPIAIYIVLYLY